MNPSGIAHPKLAPAAPAAESPLAAAPPAPSPAKASAAREPNAPKGPNGLPGKLTVQDLEIKYAPLIFQSVWAELEEEFGQERLRFPREIFWLNGAPGAGKGTHTRFILKHRGYPQNPVVVSELLKSPEARKRMDAGLLVGDREVTALVLRALINPVYGNGTVVDGYPRTGVQVECLKLFYQKLMAQCNAFRDTPLEAAFPRPRFHILVLFIDEAESIRRQLLRGRQSLSQNAEVSASGEGSTTEIRNTDLSEEAARSRYRTFKVQTYESLKALREVFYYHYINAQGTVEEVQARVLEELTYQSSLELEEGTFDFISAIPLAGEIIQHARQDLVTRLDSYAKARPELFRQVADFVQQKIMPIVIRHAISGLAQINSEDSLFADPAALGILIDIFSERGYHAVVDIHRVEIPESVDPQTFQIKTRHKKVFRIQVRFPGSEIRRGS